MEEQPKRDPAHELLLRDLVGELTNIIARQMERNLPVKTEEVRAFIRQHDHVPEFRSLAITMLLLAEGG